MTAQATELSPGLRRLQSILVRVVVLLLAGLFRLTDLVIVVFRPRLLRTYVTIWWAQLRQSPYKWPTAFADVEARKEVGQTEAELVYGETPIITALQLFRRAGVGSHSKLVDLTAGRGRALIAARFLGAEVSGTELIERHVELVGPALARSDIEMALGDGGTTDISTATHVFLAWSGFTPATIERFTRHLRSLPEKARVVCVGHPLSDSRFNPLAEGTYLFTWGPARAWIYEHHGTEGHV